MSARVERTGAVTVLGSANLDLIAEVPHVPSPGETVLSTKVRRAPGGKGLNQAIAASRAGAAVRFIGAVGTDDTGTVLVDALRSDGVDTSRLRSLSGDSGMAIVQVEDAGENAIVVLPGANSQLDKSNVTDLDWAETDVLLMQLEVPIATVYHAAVAAHGRCIVILNAAPARPLPAGLLAVTDVLIVNEHECKELSGQSQLGAAMRALAAQVPMLIVTLGASGATWYINGHPAGHLDPPTVAVVDTTGAGDTFCGSLGAHMAHDRNLTAAIRYAVTASAVATESTGASGSIPQKATVTARMLPPGVSSSSGPQTVP
jgi:ribokinase